MVKFRHLHESAELVEHLVCFTRKPDHQGGSNADPPLSIPYSPNQFPVGLLSGFPTHGFQESLVYVLEGQIEVGADGFLRINQIQEPFRYIIGMYV